MSTDKRDLIFLLAKQSGVSYAAQRKWVQRGVPAKWQITLVEKSDGLLSFDDFKNIGQSAA